MHLTAGGSDHENIKYDEIRSPGDGETEGTYQTERSRTVSRTPSRNGSTSVTIDSMQIKTRTLKDLCCSPENRPFMYMLGILFIVYGLVIILNDQVIHPLLDDMDQAGVQSHSPTHVAYFCLFAFFVYLPHPLLICGLYYTCVGFYFNEDGIGIIMLLTMCALGVCQCYVLALLIKGNKSYREFFQEKEENFVRFRAALEAYPTQFLFLFQFWFFQAQYLLLLPHIFSDIPFYVMFPATYAGHVLVLLPPFLIGYYAQDLADALDPTEGSATVFVLCSIVLVACGVLFLYSFYKLRQTMESVDFTLQPLVLEGENFVLTENAHNEIHSMSYLGAHTNLGRLGPSNDEL